MTIVDLGRIRVNRRQLAVRLRAAIDKRGESIRKVAGASGISEQTIGALLLGRRPIVNQLTLFRLFNVLGLDLPPALLDQRRRKWVLVDESIRALIRKQKLQVKAASNDPSQRARLYEIKETARDIFYVPWEDLRLLLTDEPKLAERYEDLWNDRPKI